MMRITKTAPRNRGIIGPDRWPSHRLAKKDRDGLRKNSDSDGGSTDASTPSAADPIEGKTNRPRIGLALSAGGARGLTHIGVIQVLEENGIRIDCVAGTSMGAYVGACWCRGHDGQGLEKIALTHRGRFGPWKLVDLAWPFRRGLIRGNKVESSLRKSIGEVSFAELKRPLAMTATRFDNLQPFVMQTGDVASAARASCSMPGICVPAIRDGIELFDGGMTDPLAIGALSYLGADRIIACCALRDPRHKRLNLKRKRMTSPRFRAFLRFLNSRLNPFAKGNVYDVVMRAVEAAQFRVLEHDLPEPDVVIRPSTTRLRWYAFHKPERYVEAGRRAAESKIEAIKTLVEAPVEKRRIK